VCARACTVLMSLPVTACASERNWSKLALTYVPDSNPLGVESAQKLIHVQQNDLSTRIPRGIAGADI
jgi:hAT family C-terminal dimerisation region